MNDVWFGVSTFLAGCIVTGTGGYFAVMRGQLSKSSHDEICGLKQQPIYTELKNIKDSMSRMNSKLDRILMNGKGGQ